MKDLTKQERLQIYKMALVYQKQDTFPFAMCYCLAKAELKVTNGGSIRQVIFSEFYKYKPSKYFIFAGARYWFYPNDNEIRIQLWKKIIKEMEESL